MGKMLKKKKDTIIRGSWNGTTTEHLGLLADNFVFMLKDKLALDWKVLDSIQASVRELVRSAADVAWKDCASQYSLEEMVKNTPAGMYTTYERTIKPVDKNGNVMDEK
jgi:hypothetical protein